MEEPPLLQAYRRDRRKLLDFILSSGLITEIRTLSGPTSSICDIDLDLLSADYVLQCIQSGGVLDISEATKRYYDQSSYPLTIHSQSGDSYFLFTDPKSAGSPPRHAPPRIEVNRANDCASIPSSVLDSLVGKKIPDISATTTALKPLKNVTVSPLGLPSLSTGLSDDDLRESAYEILLACMVSCGVEIYSLEDRKKEKGPKFLSSLKSRKDRRHQQYRSPKRHPEIIDTIRGQMQISEAMDACIRQSLMQFASRETCGEIDVFQICLGLLNGISKSKFLNEKSYLQWKKRQANIIEELFSSPNHVPEHHTLGILLAKIRNEWDTIMSPSERAEVLLVIRQVASLLSSRPSQIDFGSYYRTACYHINIRIYEKLLVGIFDILEEGQLIEEADEILKVIQLTWSTLGITQKMHNALFGWVFFQQFVGTDEAALLDLAILEVQKVISAEGTDGKEEQYMNSLICSTVCNGSETKPSLVQAILVSMSIWCDSKLKDYHLHFSQKPGLFGRVMTMALAVGKYTFVECDEMKSTNSDALSEVATRKLRTYIERSIEAACWRVADLLALESKIERTHPLALLANELRLIAERELNVFFPVFCRWYPEASMVSAIMLHQFYGERLKPFLKEVSCLSEDVRTVLPAANILEHCLTQLYSSACEGTRLHSPCSQQFDLYQIGEVCRPIILDWVIAQSEHILEWTGRAINFEDWEPLSNQQKLAASAVEVFRIIEETVDQFFGLSLPMDITHFQALLSILFHTLDGYLAKLVSQLVEEHHLYPSAPPLTRYKEAGFPMTKKKLIDSVLLEEEVKSKLNELTIPKLCIRLNTLQYIQEQIGTLEDGIRKSWVHTTPSENQGSSKGKPPDTSERVGLMCRESVDELFVATLDSIRDTAADAIKKLCVLIGTRVVFWDLRDSFLLHLYRGSIDSTRLESILPHFDIVLNHICGLIHDTLRDRVVSSICRASMEGYVWVLLDGGPSRAFSHSDIRMMEDDLNLLKDFFVADGEGLPRSLVEKEAAFSHQLLDLFSLQTESVIQMLMTASEHISTELGSRQHGSRCLGDAHTLIRILCHKKDQEASKFLKKQYQLPASSEYDDTPLGDSTSRSPVVTSLLKRNTSFHWAGKSHSGFKSIRKKFQRAASEIRHHSAW